MCKELCAIGIDLGGTKIEVARVDLFGVIQERIRLPTDVKGGSESVKNQMLTAIRELNSKTDCFLIGVGIGVAGQIDAANGAVYFAPNLNWHDVPLQEELSRDLKTSVVVVNDVRAATWGEWKYGAGRGTHDLICLFVGTGIGGGIVSGGQLVSGCSNAAGEIGHMTVDLHGPLCTCGNRGCLESLAGGWAIAKSAKKAVESNEAKGQFLLALAEGI